MKTQQAVWFALCAAALFSVGCAEGTVSGGEELSYVSPSDAEELEQGCDEVLGHTRDEDLRWSATSADSGAVVLDGPDGSCIDDRSHVLEVLGAQHREDLASRIMADFADADPSPHPDLHDFVMADPSPHPDKSAEATADPSPHPDQNTSGDDDDGDGVVVVVVVQIVTVGPPPPPPTSNRD